GKPVAITSAHRAFELGITAIHQETVLFDDLSVAENIFLGHAPRTRLGTVDWKTMRTRARETLDAMGAQHIEETARLRDLSIANRHLVAVARALSIDAEVVIMDEPTASLSHKEIEDLFVLIELLKQDNRVVLFISHKFDEIYRIADRFVVFRDGELVGKGLVRETPQSDIVRMMVGRSVDTIFPKRPVAIGAPVLTVHGLSHPTEFADISFELRRGEILGFYGLVGAGRSELMQAIFGITRPSRGSIALEGRTINPRSPADAIAAGIVYVPEERGRQGVVLALPIVANVSLPSLRRTSTRAGFLRPAKEFALAREYATRLDLRAASLSQEVGTLSGGNQQKVVIAKWLATQPRVIILDEPTKGIDIGSKAAVHAFMGELVAEGLSVIMVSSELPEVMGMSDRIIVMREGRMVGSFDNDGALTAETLVMAAAGITERAA
ncbi:MAG TPA: sugar ABC transporter ATP-binding protein, partial [Alphaproteobacteria bacterium]|nr:sugar ABC transporter ATP-binding protein [Alphaproteobacteria bacterium]